MIKKVKGYWQRLLRKTLQGVFHFDKWHLSPLLYRRYALDIVDYLNAMENRKSIVEIGCGLGDILRSVRFAAKYGYDADTQALKAAQVLSMFQYSVSKPVFRKFIFPSSTLDGRHDAIVLVNWIHHIEPETLRLNINNFYENNLNRGGVIIVDTVADPAYRYNHNINQLTSNLSTPVECIGTYERKREVWAIKKL